MVAVNETEPCTGWPSWDTTRYATVYRPLALAAVSGWQTEVPAATGAPAAMLCPSGPVAAILRKRGFAGSAKVSTTAGGSAVSVAPSAGLLETGSLWADAGAVLSARMAGTAGNEAMASRMALIRMGTAAPVRQAAETRRL